MTPNAQKPATTKDGVLFIRNVPGELKHEFKVLCAQRGESLTQRVIKLIADDVRAEKRIKSG